MPKCPFCNFDFKPHVICINYTKLPPLVNQHLCWNQTCFPPYPGALLLVSCACSSPLVPPHNIWFLVKSRKYLCWSKSMAVTCSVADMQVEVSLSSSSRVCLLQISEQGHCCPCHMGGRTQQLSSSPSSPWRIFFPLEWPMWNCAKTNSIP